MGASSAGELYPSQGLCCYQLRSMSLQDSVGAASATWREPGGGWHLQSGSQRRTLGSWSDLCHLCASDCLLPQLLFFEADN